MRRYETVFISDPDIAQEDRKALFDRVREIVSGQGGFLVEFDEWGTQKMAYEVRGKIRGHYTRLDYVGEGVVVDELERFFRIDERVAKFITVLLDKDADLEAIKRQAEEARAAKAAEAEAARAAEAGEGEAEAGPADGEASDSETDATEEEE